MMKKPVLIAAAAVLAALLVLGVGFIIFMENRDPAQNPADDSTGKQSQTGTPADSTGEEQTGTGIAGSEEASTDDTQGQTSQDPTRDTQGQTSQDPTKDTQGQSAQDTTVATEATETTQMETEPEGYLDEDELPLVPAN